MGALIAGSPKWWKLKSRPQTDPLPLTVSLGGAYRLAGPLNLALDVRHEVYDRRTGVGLGTEYALLPSLALRMGYGSQLAGAVGLGGSPLAGVSGGLGLKSSNYRADYTFAPFNGGLGNVQRISMGASF